MFFRSLHWTVIILISLQSYAERLASTLINTGKRM